MPEDMTANRLARVPPRTEWFAGIESGHNRRGYLRDVGEFMRHAGLREPEELRDAAAEQVEAWREALLARPLRPATVRRKLSALSSLFDELLAGGAAAANPVRGVGRPADEEGRHAAPVLTGEQARRLLDAPPGNTIKGLRDRAILAVMLCQGLTREELCGLSVGDLVGMDGRPLPEGRRQPGPDAHYRAASPRRSSGSGTISTGRATAWIRPARCSVPSPTIAAAGSTARSIRARSTAMSCATTRAAPVSRARSRGCARIR